MRVVWTSAAWADVDRLHAFLAEHDLDAADATFDKLASAAATLVNFPRRGSRLGELDPREVRELHLGRYLLRYELAGTDIFVLRFFHAREHRF